MRIRCCTVALALCAVALAPGPSVAQTITVEEALDANRDIYGPPPPRRECYNRPGEEGEDIVVCAEQERDYSQFRVQSTAEEDPDSREALNDGVPRAPDVAGDGIFSGEATTTGGCFLQGCPPPEPIIVDFTLLPEAPEGSDADRIAKGELAAD